jgi:hypothetical protein
LSLKGPIKAKEGLEEISNQLKIISNDFNSETKKFSSNFTKLLQQVKEKEEEMFLKSKIIKTIEDQNKLLAFFTDKKVTGAEMLYRASENEFLVSKWHEKCDNIPQTLTIIENEFGKVIGGYTLYAWHTDTAEHYISARTNSNDHFIFSLTNNDKFMITQNEAKCIRIFNNNTYGPMFGGGTDLFIYDKANQNSSSGNAFCFTYTNANYKYNESASYTKFSGASTYKIK